jgi:hypothetical protein
MTAAMEVGTMPMRRTSNGVTRRRVLTAVWLIAGAATVIATADVPAHANQLLALAGSVGAAVLNVVVTDMWTTARDRYTRRPGRGCPQRQASVRATSERDGRAIAVGRPGRDTSAA